MYKIKSISLSMIILSIILAFTFFNLSAQQDTPTPKPPCQIYHLTTNIGVYQSCPGNECSAVDSKTINDAICVLGVSPEDADWLIVETENTRDGIAYLSAAIAVPGDPSVAATPDVDRCNAWQISAEEAIVRQCPDNLNCSVLGTLQQGETVCVTDYFYTYIDWIEIENGGGWVNYDLIKTVKGDIDCDAWQPKQGTINVYAEPDLLSRVIRTLPAEQGFCAAETTIDNSQDIEWVSINYPLPDRPVNTGWLYSTLLIEAAVEPEIEETEESLITLPTATPTTITSLTVIASPSINNTFINVRAGDNSRFGVLTTLNRGEAATLIGVSPGGWYFIELANGIRGWVAPQLVTTTESIEFIPTVNPNIDLLTVESISQPQQVVAVITEATNTETATTAPTATAIRTATTESTATEAATTQAPTLSPTTTVTAPSLPTEPASASIATELPACQYYQINVDSAVIRSRPTTESAPITTVPRNTVICVLGAVPYLENEWFIIDLNSTGGTASIGFIHQTLLVQMQGPTPTLAPTNTPSITPTSDGITTPTATPPIATSMANANATTTTIGSNGVQICPTNTPDPFVPNPFSNTTAVPSAIPVNTEQAPANCIIASPTPLLTPPPTRVASEALLSQDLVLTNLRVKNFELMSPAGTTQFRFTIPDDWNPIGSNILYLNVEYFLDKTRVSADASLDGVGTELSIRLDDQLISSIFFKEENVGDQTLQIPLPAELLTDPSKRSHTVTIELSAREHCEVKANARMFARSDLSYIHFEYNEFLPILDLAKYPRPFYNNRPNNEIETVFLVLPQNASLIDWQAAASIGAGIGLLTSSELQIRVTTEDKLSQNDRQANHLILIGTIESNSLIRSLYDTNLLPTQYKDDQVMFQDTVVESTDGLLQLIAHPENPKRAILVATSQTDQGIMKAGQALAGPPALLGLGGTLAIIKNTEPIIRLTAEALALTRFTFESIGVLDDIILSGIGVQVYEIGFNVPPGGPITEEAYVDIIYNNSLAIESDKALFTLIMNDIPIGSALLKDETSTNQQQGFKRLRVAIPPSTIIPGASNSLIMEVSLGESFGCNPPSREAAWFTISRNSELYLPQSTVNIQNFAPRVSHFPIPFNTQPNLGDVWVVLSENPSMVELEKTIQILSYLGDSTVGEGFIPKISFGDFPTDTDELGQYHFIVVGRPTNNPLLAQLNGMTKDVLDINNVISGNRRLLPQPFAANTDELEQVLDDVHYRLLPGFEIGVLETINSPWNNDRRILIVTGTADQGISDAAQALIESRFSRGDLDGDVIFVVGNQVTAIDSSTVYDLVEEVLGEAATTVAIAASNSTHTPVPVYTVTAGPTPTPLPTRTPVAAEQNANILVTNTVIPTVQTAIPTQEAPPDLEQTVIEEPVWVQYLIMLTGGVVGVSVLFALIQTFRRQRRRR